MKKINFIFSVISVSVFMLSGCATSTNSARYPADAGDKGGPGDRGGAEHAAAPAERGGGDHQSPGAHPAAHTVPDQGRQQVVQDHSGHAIVDVHGGNVHAPVFEDKRPIAEIRANTRVYGYHDVVVRGDWHTYYPVHGWIGVWNTPGFAWDRVTEVVCEAVNVNSNGAQTYPASGYTSGGWAWSDATVNQLLGQALDDCDLDPAGAKDANGNNICVAASPACTPTYASSGR
jgi:hypothetical protein